MAREVGLMEVSGQNVQRIGATTTPTDRAVGSSCSTDNGADKCRKQPSLFLCPNKQCTAEKTNMSRQIAKMPLIWMPPERASKKACRNVQQQRALQAKTSNKQLNDKILSLQNELKDQAAEGTQALKAYEKKAMEAQKAVEATLAQTAQDYRKLQDIYNHQTNRFQVVWREKEEMRLGIVQTKNNFRTEMELVVQENLSLRLELSEKNASLQAASKTESVRQELMREAKELMEDANDRTEAAAEELTAVKRDLQSKIDSLEEQVGKLKEECEIAKSDSEKRKQELAEKEDTIAESFQLLEQMEKRKSRLYRLRTIELRKHLKHSSWRMQKSSN
uniref:Uncharacterized protein n=1 Tax=Ditylenchus dipsaci TaxID=166011 RepID=A0A915EJV1_9BILA